MPTATFGMQQIVRPDLVKKILRHGQQIGSRSSDVAVFHRVIYRHKLYEIATSLHGDRSVWWIGCVLADNYFE